MAELKTKLNGASVDDFLNAIKDEQVRKDCWTIVDIMQKATNAKPQTDVGRRHRRVRELPLQVRQRP
jgi:hypothetical protein